MQVKDEQAWTTQLMELEADDYTRKFKTFLVFWMDTADKMVLEQFPLNSDHPKLQLAAAVGKALAVAEQTFGFLAVEWIAQMLLIMTEHWKYGDDLYEDLSLIERRLVDTAIAMKLTDLQESARLGASIPTEE